MSNTDKIGELYRSGEYQEIKKLENGKSKLLTMRSRSFLLGAAIGTTSIVTNSPEIILFFPAISLASRYLSQNKTDFSHWTGENLRYALGTITPYAMQGLVQLLFNS